ncbi:hypothetical protein B879_04123 [Cecembia lonarensis LW9]|uniref:Uncharacterized protein n=1 Tax=Cecembia lonarensis (strain CCUG 58316 / KCTC 22772 / LW9) TaxID=1225176 RepID=K1L5J0_CECL9|nr:hypothetical protein B879_04123 [Cecembia lonarensis LW9]
MTVNHGVLGSSPRGGAKAVRWPLFLFLPLSFNLRKFFYGCKFLKNVKFKLTNQP